MKGRLSIKGSDERQEGLQTDRGDIRAHGSWLYLFYRLKKYYVFSNIVRKCEAWPGRVIVTAVTRRCCQ